jgi:hypothetical protein
MSKGPHVLVHLNSENSWHDLPGLKLWVADVVAPHRKEVIQSELEQGAPPLGEGTVADLMYGTVGGNTARLLVLFPEALPQSCILGG